MISFTFEQTLQQFMLLMRSFVCLTTVEDLHAIFVKYQSTNDGVDRVVMKPGQLCSATPFLRKYEGTQMSGCDKAAENNWTQNWRKYGAADLVTKLILINKRLLLHTCHLTGEWHARKFLTTS